MPLLLEIVTPESRVYEQTVDSVVIPTTAGEIGVLPGHIPIVSGLEAGELVVSAGGKTTQLVVGPGFVQVDGDKVSVLADSAIDREVIDENAVQEAMKRAQDALDDKTLDLDPADIDRLESILRFSAAQLAAAVRRKRR